jgi:hypothetical protein
MVIVKLMGGLGNQMFQYAAGRSLSLKNNCPLKLDLSFLLDRTGKPADFVFRDYDLDIFNLSVGFADSEEVIKLRHWYKNKTLDKLFKAVFGRRKSYYKQPYFHFDNSFFDKTPPVYLDGYWQSEKFFQPYESIIRKDFEFKNPLIGSSVELAGEIKQNNAVCVNIRRGDFVSSDMHGALDPGYYKSAETLLISRVESPFYYVFSDDVEWCIDNIRFNGPVKYITHEYAGWKFSNYLQLMRLCKHFIIPNSSFGWWAAWLSDNHDKMVVAPEKWFNQGPKDTQDVIPGEWYKI